MIGHTVGHYRILERLGGGGMGIVYKAEDLKLGRCVALKFLPPELTRDDEARARFLHEARAAAQLDHPNICTVYDVGEAEDDRVWIAMACYEGETLRKIIEAGRPPVGMALKVVLQLARGLAKAHSSGIVHRDIKPANVMVTPDGVVKILDFGLAKLEGSSVITAAGKAVGTTAYMSPEQLLCEEVGPQADIWSLGVVTYELLTGQRPFRGEYEQAAIYSILNQDPPSLTSSRPDAPTALDAIVGKMLRRNPKERYQSVDDVIADLSELAAPRTGSERLIAAAQRVGRRAWRPVAACAAIAVVSVAAFMFVTRRNDAAPAPVAAAPALPEIPIVGVLPFQDISEESLAPMIGAGFANALSARLGGVFELQVVAPSSEDIVQARSIRELCRETGANVVLRGTLQRSGDRVRATWNLVDASGRQLGGNFAESSVSRVLELQDAVTTQLLASLKRPTALAPMPAHDAFQQDLYLQAIGYLVRYDDAPSVDSAIAILEKLEDTKKVQAALGRAYLNKFLLSGRDKQWAERSREACAKAAAGGGGDADVHRTLGELYLATSKLDHAGIELKHALDLRPKDADIRLAYADYLDRTEHPDEAEKQFQLAIALRPGNWAGHNKLGTFYLRRGRFDAALVSFKAAERLTPENTFVLANEGVALQWLGRDEEAIAAYRRSIRIRPTGPTYNNLAALLYFAGRYDEAVDAFEGATAIDPNDHQLWAGLADSLRWSASRRQQAPTAYRKAISLAEKELELSPRDPLLLAMLASYQAKLGDKARAIPTARLAVETAPENMMVNYIAGLAMEVAGSRPDALVYVKHALEHGYSEEEIRRDPEMRALVLETDVLTDVAGGKEGT
ncbi:MAG: protein kinase [Thermoanaerobaculia bacterium]|jgi:serine/threonine-protein kinase